MLARVRMGPIFLLVQTCHSLVGFVVLKGQSFATLLEVLARCAHVFNERLYDTFVPYCTGDGMSEEGKLT